jgi:hypothetical protein
MEVKPTDTVITTRENGAAISVATIGDALSVETLSLRAPMRTPSRYVQWWCPEAVAQGQCQLRVEEQLRNGGECS